MQAVWNGTVIAESDDTADLEGNFPADAIKSEHSEPSSTTTVCPWKGTASYHTVVIEGVRNEDAAWYHPETNDAATNVEGRVALWRDVERR
jgi:uncharacterized protein (DUF427 family)